MSNTLQKALDRMALASLDRRLCLIDDRVTGVVRGFQTGLYLCGAGGLGKSYSVFRQLQELECDFRAFNARMTALGLFNALERRLWEQRTGKRKSAFYARRREVESGEFDM
jgi:hypothetical protein